jgi:hypothetical protein
VHASIQCLLTLGAADALKRAADHDVRTRGNVVRVPTPQELTFAPAFTVSRAANACSSGLRVQQQMGFAPVARVARGAVLAGCSALGVGYSVLLSPGAMQPT